MSQTPKRGLGKGFDALLSNDFDRSLLLSREDTIEKIAIKRITPNPNQPRKHFDEKALKELASSISRYGIIQPLVLTPHNNDYLLIAGERRLRAAVLAGLETVPGIIREKRELDQLEIALIENVQRVDLSPLEQAWSIAKLRDQFNLSYEDIAKRLGKASTTVINTYRLINLPEKAAKALADNLISEGHARTILALKNDSVRQDYLLNCILKNGWSVREAERFVLSVKAGTKKTAKVHEHVATETKETKVLSKKLGTQINIRRTAHGGKLEISFKNDQELNRIIKFFS